MLHLPFLRVKTLDSELFVFLLFRLRHFMPPQAHLPLFSHYSLTQPSALITHSCQTSWVFLPSGMRRGVIAEQRLDEETILTGERSNY
jgi:hypothetical protein